MVPKYLMEKIQDFPKVLSIREWDRLMSELGYFSSERTVEENQQCMLTYFYAGGQIDIGVTKLGAKDLRSLA